MYTDYIYAEIMHIRWRKSKGKHKENIFWRGYRIIRCFKVALNIMLKKSLCIQASGKAGQRK